VCSPPRGLRTLASRERRYTPHKMKNTIQTDKAADAPEAPQNDEPRVTEFSDGSAVAYMPAQHYKAHAERLAKALRRAQVLLFDYVRHNENEMCAFAETEQDCVAALAEWEEAQ
jgi:hypothetical protein